MSSQEFIVREISLVETNLNTLTFGQFEDFNNAGRFFNDTTLTLDLVAFRLGAIIDAFPSILNAAVILKIYGVVELSRQAQIFQQEGILGSVRATMANWGKVDANGGLGNQTLTVGEMIYGDFKTKLMTLEQQTNIFLNGRIISSGHSGDALVATLGELQGGATCYFKRKGGRRR
jgi:hypothetical protein